MTFQPYKLSVQVGQYAHDAHAQSVSVLLRQAPTAILKCRNLTLAENNTVDLLVLLQN